MSGEVVPAGTAALANTVANVAENPPATGQDNSAAASCPRCGAHFHCGVNDSTPCACSTLQLSAAQLTELRQRYGDCLCLACLTRLSA